MPTRFDDEVEFGLVEATKNLTLHCACTEGVVSVLRKPDATSADPSTTVRDSTSTPNITLILTPIPTP